MNSNAISLENLRHSMERCETMRTRLVKTVCLPSDFYADFIFLVDLTNLLVCAGGQIGHRKYDCPEQRNFTANIICRVCGNAGHMARDCPDRQRGQNWRNDDRRGAAPGFGRPGAAGLGQGDAVDREYEVSNTLKTFSL